MRVGIIGAGHIAEVHGPSILNQKNASIVGIADKNLTSARITAQKFKLDHFYDDAAQMIKERKPDVVHILVPPQHHAELSILAMELGCHVLVEKPMALSIESAKKMIAVAQKNHVKLCVNHNLIFTSTMRNAFRLVSRGAIGKPISAEACFLFDPRRYPVVLEDGAEHCHWSYRLNGGPLQDQLPHPASLVFELMNHFTEIQSISQNNGILATGWHDELRVLLNSDNMLGVIGISFREKPDTITFTIKGTQGIVQADLFSDILTIRSSSLLPRAAARGLAGIQFATQYIKGFGVNIYKFLRGHIDKSNGIAPLIAAFYSSIQNDTPVPIAPERSLRVVELMANIWPKPTVERAASKVKRPTTIAQTEPTILVTGASGFIGTHLIHKLIKENASVRALVRPNSIHAGRLKGLNVEVFEGDLANPETLLEATKGIDTVYHAGSPMSNNRAEYEEIAVNGTDHLIKAALANKVNRFIQFSSLTVYELLKLKRKNIDESSPFQENPELMGPYAWAKIEIEKRVREAYHRDGLAITIVRPGIVIGPYCHVFFPHLGYNLQERVFLVIGRGNNVLPLTYIENTVDAIYRSGTTEKAIGQAYNIVDDGKITVQQYIEEFIKITADSRKLIKLPYVLPYSATLAYELAAHFGMIKKGITSRPQLKWKQSKVTFDNSKAKNELGWQPMIGINEALSTTFEWYLNKYYK